MAHALIPQIIVLASPVAESLGLSVVGAVFHTHQSPPVLRVDISNPQGETRLDDCERMSRALAAVLDPAGLLPEAYILEISSPGISRFLSTDRDFSSFKGFPMIVRTCEPYQGHKEWVGKLIGRDENLVYLSQKGRKVKIPRQLVTQVQLDEGH